MIGMYFVNKDLSIYATRGDAVVLAVGANNNGVPYVFQPGEVVRFRVFEKKGCHCTVLQKDFIITDAVESVDIVLTKNETEIGEIISKPKDYWYEIELNPNYNPQTIVGYDDDGPKVFRLFPEGADVAGGEGEAPDNYVPAIGGYLPYVTEADNGKTVRVVDGEWELAEGGGNITVDDALNGESTNPVQNKVIAREILRINGGIQTVHDNALAAANEAMETANSAGLIGHYAKQSLEIDVVPRLTALEKSHIYAVHFTEQELTDEQKAQARKNIGASLPPLKFTVTKSEDGKYTSSKTYQELSDALAEERTLICEFYGAELPLVNSSSHGFSFASDISGVQRSVQIFADDELPIHGSLSYPYIKIGDQMWGGEDEELNVDFTDTINDMIDDKVSSIKPETAIDNLQIVNARDYGAKGDGVTDDTEAIQAALYAAEEQKVPLYIPAGHYRVSKTISTHKRATDSDKQSKELNIFGAGMNTRILAGPDFEGEYVFYIDVKNTQPRMLWVHDFAINLYADVSGIYFEEIGMKSVIENLWINHLYDKDPTDTNHRAGIDCREATVATFQHIKVFGNRERCDSGHENIGIVCHRSFSNRFVDCDIIYCRWAIYINSGSSNTIDNCRIDENEYGVYQNSSAKSINYMPETRAYPAVNADEEGHHGTFRTLTIRNNRFEGNNQQAIFLAAHSNGEGNYMYNAQVIIENNDFSKLGAGIAFQTTARKVFRKAIHLFQCKCVVIANNTFEGMPYDESNAESLLQVLAGERVDDLTIRGNVAPTGALDDDTIAKSSPKISAKLLNYKFYKWQPLSLAEQGIVDDIEVDQSTRDRWRSEIGNVDAALDSIIAIQESFIGGDGE